MSLVKYFYLALYTKKKKYTLSSESDKQLVTQYHRDV